MYVKRLAVLAILGSTLLVIGAASAQQSGDSIIFALPAGTDVTTGPEGDKVIYVGRPVGYVDATGCAGDGDARPMQHVMLVDAGSGARATRSQALVTLYVNGAPFFETPVKNGTRIANVTLDTGCTVNGASYLRYSGIIE